MKKACLSIVLVWAALVAVYARLAWRELHEVGPTAVLAVLGGTFTSMLVAGVAGLFTSAKDRAALRRALSGEPFEDGRLEAASGPVRVLGEPLKAPFTGRPCAAYEYDVKPPRGGESDFAGVAMVPWTVDSPRGPAKLLGWAVLDRFPSADSASIDRGRAEDYLRGAPLEDVGIARLISAMAELVADDDGALRKDFRIGGRVTSLAGRSLKEKSVTPGQVVTAMGIFSRERGGFTPMGRAALNRLYPGRAEDVLARTAGDARRTLVVAIVFFLLFHGFLAAVYSLKRGSIARRPAPSVWDERDCDRMKAHLAQGADPNEKTMGDTPLMRSAGYGFEPCVEALLAAGARVNDADERGDTALARAVMAGHEDVIATLKRAGARDFRVTAENGRPATSDSMPFRVVAKYLAALQAEDFDTMVSLYPGTSKARLQESRENLDLWKAYRPKEPQLVAGFENDDAATLTVKGPTARGEKTWFYHLEKGFEGWRIYREWTPPGE